MTIIKKARYCLMLGILGLTASLWPIYGYFLLANEAFEWPARILIVAGVVLLSEAGVRYKILRKKFIRNPWTDEYLTVSPNDPDD